MATVDRAPADSRTSPLYAFDGKLEAPPTSASYHAALILVAGAMVLLPAIYAGLVGATAYGVYYHAVHNLTWLAGGAIKGRIIVYVTPIVIGSIMVVFMLKPFFALRAREREPLLLDRRREPLLFAFMEKICRTVGAPAPGRIQVDCNVNASAGHLGVVSLVHGQLVLTIGLPLVTGLTLRQFTGVMAHEFGHFSQGAGMRVSNLIRRVNHWLARVVYERDAWDQMLVSWSEDSEDGYMRLLGYLARFFVWLSRGALRLIMIAGHAVSCLLMRQMEYDADVYEIRLGGTETFASTALQLRVLSAATQTAFSELSDSWREGRLAADLPTFIARRATEMPAPMLAAVKRSMTMGETGWFDTHPCDRDRLARAREQRQAGIFRMEAPATVLFRNFDELAREATFTFYRETLGDEFSAANLVGNEVLYGHAETEDAAERCLVRYGREVVDSEPPLFLGIESVPAAPADAAARVAAARHGFETALAAAPAVLDKVGKADDMVRRADLAMRLLQMKATIDARTFNLPTASLDGAERARRRGLEIRDTHGAAAEAVREALRQRFVAALAGLRDPALGAGLSDRDAAVARANEELKVLAALENVFPRVLALRDRVVLLATLGSHVPSNPENRSLQSQIESMPGAFHESLSSIRSALARTPYPFDHASGKISVADYALAELPPMDDLSALYDAAEVMLGNLFTLQRRLLARLATAAEPIEAAAGLPAAAPAAAAQNR